MPAPWYQLPSGGDLQNLTSQTGKPRVAIFGAGLAGCCLARELAERGVGVALIERACCVAAGASGSPIGIAMPYVSRADAFANEFYKTAFAYLQLRMDEHSATSAELVPARGVLKLIEPSPSKAGELRCLSTSQASDFAGTNVNSPAIVYESGGCISPKKFCLSLVDHPLIDLQLNQQICAMNATPKGWRIAFAASAFPLLAPHVIIATGHTLNDWTYTAGLSLTPVRGQISQFLVLDEPNPLQCIVSGKHYAIPQGQSIWVGATFSRHDTDSQLRSADHDQNRLGLRNMLPNLNIGKRATGGRAGVRATTPDRFPLVGPAPDIAAYRALYHDLHHGKPVSHYPPPRYFPNLHVLGGFGSRGVVSSPYSARLLADWLCNKKDSKAHSSEPDLQDWARLLHPARFCIRDLKRAR